MSNEINRAIMLERYEIAEILAKNFRFNDEQYDASDFEWAAHCLLEAGYRKQREGEWIITMPITMRVWDSDCITCSVCGGKSVGLLEDNKLNYCPHCGARMKGGERMTEYKCPKCNSTNLFTRKKDTQTGLYCKECGRWIKWLNKDEARVFELNNSKNDLPF